MTKKNQEKKLDINSKQKIEIFRLRTVSKRSEQLREIARGYTVMNDLCRSSDLRVLENFRNVVENFGITIFLSLIKLISASLS